MSDIETIIRLAEKLGLTRVDTTGDFGVNDLEFVVSARPDGTSDVVIGAGKDGYNGFYARFHFDADGNIVDHGVFE